MTIIRPITPQDIRLKEKIAKASIDADLNLSEILALNNKFGTTLEYVPKNDVIEVTHYMNKNSKSNADSFSRECLKSALEMFEKFGKSISEKFVVSDKSSLAGNLESALKKLKNVL